jgi:electron transfer flavoprotein alpha subunit
MPEIWAVLEHREGILQEQSSELIAELAQLAERQLEPTTLRALLLARPGVTLTDTLMVALTHLGIEYLCVLEHPVLAHYTTEGYVASLAWMLQQQPIPLLIVANATANGRDWMPRLAARLHLPGVPNCLGLDLHDDALFALRVVYDGRAYIQTRTPLHGRTALATLVPGVPRMPLKAAQGKELIVKRITPKIPTHTGQERIRQVALEAPSPEAVELEAAERIVSGGRGIGQSGFTQLASFARLLGAAVGATRVATDRGWIEPARQIGATGKSVHPKLYIACGISGAAQHTSGMRDAQTIIAINPDRSAPIFALAELGLLGDANQILPLAARMLDTNAGQK